jgi:hypothetical protein
LGLSFTTALVLSGYCAFLWLEKIVDRRAAFLAAVLYMLLPYHLPVDLYYRFSLAEFWAFVWMPLILYATKEIIRGKKNATLKFAVSYALLIMTHLPTTLIFSGIPPIYALVSSDQGKKTKNLLLTVAAMGLGIGLSSIYLLPALTTQEYVNFQFITMGGWKYDVNFFNLAEGAQTVESFKEYVFHLTVYSGIVAMLFYFPALLDSKIRENNRIESCFWFIIAIISIFLMLPLSNRIWQILPLLQKIQFPWRFNLLLSVAIPAIVGIGLTADSGRLVRIGRIAHVTILALILAQAVVAASLIYDRAAGNIDADKRAVIERSLEINEGAPEYLPRWVSEELVFKALNGSLSRLESKITVTEDDKAVVRILRWQPRHIELDVSGETECRLTVGQFFYPGWTARLQGNLGTLPLEASREGLLNIVVPAGDHKVVIKLEARIEERLGQITSFIIALSIVCLWIHKFLPVKKGYRI